MPYVYMKEIWTPLKVFRLRLFKCQETGRFYIKVKENSRRLLIANRKNNS